MSNNVTYQIDRPATPPNQTIIETEDQGSGVMRQIVKVGTSALPSGAATAAKQLSDNHQVTANAGTNLNTGSLALEAGGNLASIKAKTDNLDVALSTRLKPYSSTSAVTQVASSATNVTLKALNTSRLGLTIFNDSTQILYAKLGATASATSYTVKMLAGAYYEMPFGYTGIVDGIWASANGNAYVTELS